MTESPARQTARLLILLRDAIFASSRWENVAGELEERGTSLAEVRSRLKPRIEIDPHNHTVHSDGLFTIEQLIWWCKAVGLKGVGVTEHDMIPRSLGEAVYEAERLGVHLLPGVEFTLHRLGGESWRGLEVGLHFFPPRRFADFLGSSEGEVFCRKFEEAAHEKSKQGWETLQAVNKELMAPRGLKTITRDELWEASGATDPILPGTITICVLRHIFFDGRHELLDEFPDTRAIYTYMQAHHLVPPSKTPPQTFDGLIALRKQLAGHGIRSTITLNHPEEWLTKCGLTTPEGEPDMPAVRRLVLLMLLHAPAEAPISFIELYSSRNTPTSLPAFKAFYAELQEIRERFLPQLAPLHAIVSTDSHRVSGFLDEEGQMQGWVPGEDFIFGLGRVDEEYPTGSLEVPDGYPGAAELLELMDRCAT